MKILLILLILACVAAAFGEEVQFMTPTFVRETGGIEIAGPSGAVPILVADEDWAGVKRVAGDLRDDIERVTGHEPTINGSGKVAIILGTIGKSPLVDKLVRDRKLDVRGVRGTWESFVVQTVEHPMRGIEKAVVIAGSDKRGTIYGAYELSEQAGVSPWYWWADVPVKKHSRLAVTPGRYVQKSPKVKYRSIFINDEAPCLSNWVYKNFGNYKHEFYVHVFELLLRLRANYLWPAMWNNCFNEDDPLNPKMADEYGIVMGTSHVEPMMRADKEWNRLGYTADQWNYLKNPDELEKFWADGVRRNKPYESITTIAMRGKIDTPMSEDENIGLLEKIVAAQRRILAKEVNPDVTKVPQLWCLYKEVQNYYDKGMRVPDDVTLLWADDNWGNIRRLPTPEERKRSGGAGVYYHFDYVGGPRNYKWVDTSPLPRIWEQMHMAYEWKADRIWIANVGDIKPNEFPTEFFIRMGWDPDRWTAATLGKYAENWVRREFGDEHSPSIADLIEKYTKFNGRRKPELLSPSTYSLENYREAERVADDWESLAKQSQAVQNLLPQEYRDAYFQLVGYPVEASANLNLLYYAAGLNHLWAKQGRVSANIAANIVGGLFQKDRDLQRQYHTIHDGKWDHMMDQTHIGYTSWQQPDKDTPPAVERVNPKDRPAMGMAPEGGAEGVLPLLSAYSSGDVYFDLFNKGLGKLTFTATADPWLSLSSSEGELSHDKRIYVSANWIRVPKTATSGSIMIMGSDGSSFQLSVPVRPLLAYPNTVVDGFVEGDGYVSIEANHFKGHSDNGKVRFAELPGLSRTDSGVALVPTTAAPLIPTKDQVFLEYPIYLFSSGPIQIQTILSPTQLLKPGSGLRFAVSLDDGEPVEVNMHEKYVYFTPSWEASVAQNAIIKTIPFASVKPGRHKIRYWGVDPGVVLQKIVVDTGGLKPSYLGPPESTFIRASGS
ncbi:MAG: glycosyl hydrolase 115 family protein [Armatimonadetes bacterium]|nr:glycosyl hydrolase 115 family protein [Armatimonadota bacterium]